jgi:hypothetical protein
VENLLPGTDTRKAMVAAVRHARFRFVFLSSAYLKSVNCNHELRALRDQPGRTLFLVYRREHLNSEGESLAPPAEIVSVLRSEGHLMHLLPADLQNDFDSGRTPHSPHVPPAFTTHGTHPSAITSARCPHAQARCCA